MKRWGVVLAVGWLLTTAPSARAADAPAPFDSAAVVAKARTLNEAVKLGDAAALWAEFDDRMRAGVGGDVAKFEAVLKRIGAQTGVMQECISEVVSQKGEVWIYRGTCRFASAPAPLVTQYAFTAFGKVAGFFIKPDAKAYDSKFMEYATKTVLTLPFYGRWRIFWAGRTLEQNDHAVSRDQPFAY